MRHEQPVGQRCAQRVKTGVQYSSKVANKSLLRACKAPISRIQQEISLALEKTRTARWFACKLLNLHYLSHRLVHVDIPWSLMTLQQRNGRIDRYGQTQQPQIRYLLSCSRSEGMGDAEKVLRLLKRKDEQAQQNIGDPAVFLGVYDAVGEEEEISCAYESGSLDALEQRMDEKAERFLKKSSADSIFDEFYGMDGQDSEAGSTDIQVQQRQPFSLFPSLWSYVDTALEAVAEQMERRGEKLDLRADADQQRLEITPPSDLQRRYDRYPRELQPPRGQRLVLSTEVAALQRALEQSRRQDSSRPELEYLWDLHPLSGDSENWSGGDTKTGPPRGA